jgi:hypothetical protein
MNAVDMIKVALTVVAAWFVIVFLFYFLLIKAAGYKNAGFLARALYSVYLVLMFLYSIFFSPFTRYVRFPSAGFFIAIAITVLLLLFVVVSGLAGRTGKKGGMADA